ncbi:hypothetical protein Pcinc_041564 [Petrolisthes cinctipes]|uniref:Uncharacterized protein n=1 Tax=Petrolisthes cinctipes TaxID=88211 RepID=A0AAE1BJY2_PETCI|nr:hypothetical protein Pcinc_041564 [Petrolisthes cinctipes]
MFILHYLYCHTELVMRQEKKFKGVQGHQSHRRKHSISFPPLYLPHRDTLPTNLTVPSPYLPNSATLPTNLKVPLAYLPNSATLPTNLTVPSSYLPNSATLPTNLKVPSPYLPHSATLLPTNCAFLPIRSDISPSTLTVRLFLPVSQGLPPYSPYTQCLYSLPTVPSYLPIVPNSCQPTSLH